MLNKPTAIQLFMFLVGAIATLLLIWAAPVYLNFWVPDFSPKVLPAEFEHESQLQLSDSGTGRYLNLPVVFNAKQFEWSNEKKVYDFPAFLSNKPSFSSQNSYARNFLLFLQEKWQQGQRLSPYFNLAGVSRIVFRTDLKNNELSEPDKMKLREVLLRDDGLTSGERRGFITEFTNASPNEIVYANEQTLLVWGGLDTIQSLRAAQNFDPAKTNLLFAHQYLNPGQIERLADFSDALVIKNGTRRDDLIPSFIDPDFFIRPYNYLNSLENQTSWNKASVYEPLHGEWHKTLRESLQLQDWDFDYGQGLVYSMRSGEGESFFPTVMNLDFQVREPGDYYLLIRQFVNNRGEQMSYRIDNSDRKKISSYSPIGQWQWQKVETVSLTAGQHKITLENTDGFYAVNLMAFVPKAAYDRALEKVDDYLAQKKIIYTQELNVARLLAGIETELPIKSGSEFNLSCPTSECQNYNLVSDNDEKIMAASEYVKKDKFDLLRYFPGGSFDKLRLEFNETESVSGITLKIHDPAGIKLNIQDGKKWFEISSQAKSKHFRVLSEPIAVKPDSTYACDLEFQLENIKDLSVRVLQYDKIDDIGKNSPKRSDKISTKLTEDNQAVVIIDDIITRPDVNYVVFEFSAEQNKLKDSRWALTDFALAKVDDGVTEKTSSMVIMPPDFEFSNKQYPITFDKNSGINYSVDLPEKTSLLLTVTESYDDLWHAGCGTDQSFDHVMNYGFMNGFLIGEGCPGSVEITYVPQKWYRYGIWASLISIFLGAIFSLILWRKRKNHDHRE